MACNTCAKGFSLLRKEKGCPGCGFSYCSKCLDNKIFLPKINDTAKVCSKCKKLAEKPDSNTTAVQPPDAYYRRLGIMNDEQKGNKTINPDMDTTDQLITSRLQKPKDSKTNTSVTTTDEEIKNRLQNIKGEMPSTSDVEIQARLAKLRGVPIETLSSKPVLLPPDTRTEQEQANDLLKQYMEQTNIESKYKDEFDDMIKNMEARMNKLKGANSSSFKEHDLAKSTEDAESETEEESVRKIVEKLKAEAALDDDDIAHSTDDELPFCEICNEDARMRCLGCKYLFCRRCFAEHKDDDDGCNRYEPYEAPKKT